MQKILIIIIIFSSGFVFANNCKDIEVKEVDMTNELGPIRNQDSIGWCYAHTAADMMGHYLTKNGGSALLNTKSGLDFTSKENMISANSLAINYNSKKKKKYYKKFKGWDASDFDEHNKNATKSAYEDSKSFWDFFRINKPKKGDEYNIVPEGGLISQTIDISLKKNFCLEKEIPSDDFNLVLGSQNCDSNKEAGSCELLELLKQIYDFEKDGVDGKAWCNAKEAIAELFPAMSIKSIPEIMLRSHRSTIMKNLKKAVCRYQFKKGQAPKIHEEQVDSSKACQAENKIDNGKLCDFGKYNDKIMSDLDKQLEAGNIVGISYKSDFLSSESYMHTPGGHASTIVGKRLNSKTCKEEYILRNSWGPVCEQYKGVNPNIMYCLSQVTDSKSRLLMMKEEALAELTEAKISGREDLIKLYQDYLNKTKAKLENNNFTSDEQWQKERDNCSEKFPDTMLNYKLSCKDGYVYVPKDELKKNMFGVSYFK